MPLLTSEIRDFVPVVKLYTPWNNCIWLLTELDPENPDYAFGLADLGIAYPELGWVQISELEDIFGPVGKAIVRDVNFIGTKRLMAYFEEAKKNGRIIA
jgi:hypothetical protein